MDNPETSATLATQEKVRRQNKTTTKKKPKKMSNTDPTKTQDDLSVREG